jgi:hypothetical protein
MDYRQEWIFNTIGAEYRPTYASFGNGEATAGRVSRTHYSIEAEAGRVVNLVGSRGVLRDKYSTEQDWACSFCGYGQYEFCLRNDQAISRPDATGLETSD